MTGNNKFWRASLAGLASVAMLATMGVTAANAADAAKAAEYDVTIVKADGTKVSNPKGKSFAGETLADYFGGYTTGEAPSSVAGTAEKFVGWTVDGQYVDFNATISGDLTLTARVVKNSEAVRVQYTEDTGKNANLQFPDGTTTGDATYGTYWYVEQGQALNAQRVPQDVAGDGKLVTSWNADGETVDDLTKVVNVTDPDGFSIKPATIDAKAKSLIVAFTGYGYPAGGLSDGYTISGLDVAYAKDTVADSLTVPAFVVTSGDKTVRTWVDKANPDNGTTYAAGDAVDLSKGTVTLIARDTTTKHVVAFDSNGGTAVSSQTVNDGDAATLPETPTREGYVFKGWQYNGKVYSTQVDLNSLPIRGDVTFKAQWAKTTAVQVTFTDADYVGKNADVKVTVNAGDVFTEDQAPTWTREGYKFAGWTKDGVKYVFGSLIGDSQKNFTLTATWEAVKSADVETALKYVPAVAFKDATGKQVTSDQDVKNVKGDFTDSSWNAYEAEYAKVYQAYVKAQYASEKNTLSDKDAADLVNQLDAALKGLVFVSAAGTNNDGTTSRYQRLYNQWADDHIYTDGVTDDVAKLQELGWKLEPSAGFVALDPAKAAWYADEDNAGPVDTIVTRVYRFFNQYNSRHLYTADSDERVTVLEAGWTEEPSADIYVPANGSKSVYRVYNPYTGEHLYTLDANEANGLVPLGWIDEGVAFKAL
ncbi:InlB B-repeat-containing protein [Bifidobacterium vespertilionis]|uniref:DUF5648 domain-containing protein n=1 Tax=Bifidobacterium vespertilionis TaxID=2562524 RepID=A0A5J5DX42_9BIFI|nr:InlB B-repeat-containing protein [Bifidobacterium vespertilionis]KAA8819009.1 hypothetical protein EMO90_08615 [Bifidobacterium vespertilionis]KAA8821451.1 hypothetical protein EM848_10860 [Bifidobacterium vespertilionis]